MTCYHLKIHDEPLLSFEYKKGGIGGWHIEILEIDLQKTRLMPLDLETTSNGLEEWLRKRILPQNRTFAREILSSLNLKRTDIKGIMDLCKGLSLNDAY